MEFQDLPLPPVVLEGIRRVGFSRCTEIQEKTFPITLAGRDVAGQAQTGTGKTAAFLIAIFTRLLTLPPPPRGKHPSPRAFIIAPTRELAVQIFKDAQALGSATPFRMQVVYGGLDYLKQRADLESEPDILIGTPGRLIDYFKQKAYDLRRMQILVIDEADRMFDMGFIADLRFLLRRMPPYHKRQSMLFSATLSLRVMELAYEHMNNPTRIEVSPQQVTAEGIEEVLYHVERSQKFPLLLGILKREPWERILIFVNTKRQGEVLEQRLTRQGYTVRAITGDIPQKQRLRIMEQFKSKSLPILVATDVASRGLHIEDVSHVINYDLPQDPKDYVHRIGRTARAGATGKAVGLVCEEFVFSLEEIEDLIGHKIPVAWAVDEMFIKPLPFRSDTQRRKDFGHPHRQRSHSGGPPRKHQR
ncbi:MAG TPA: DEAD/DEAH box helicase [Nitrospiria bacterium]|nr:DEAD/DEAH box helicase [Nitrospiria bacterium]